MKEGAEQVHTKIQAKAESVLKQGPDSSKGEYFIFLTMLYYLKMYKIVTKFTVNIW